MPRGRPKKPQHPDAGNPYVINHEQRRRGRPRKETTVHTPPATSMAEACERMFAFRIPSSTIDSSNRSRSSPAAARLSPVLPLLRQSSTQDHAAIRTSTPVPGPLTFRIATSSPAQSAVSMSDFDTPRESSSWLFNPESAPHSETPRGPPTPSPPLDHLSSTASPTFPPDIYLSDASEDPEDPFESADESDVTPISTVARKLYELLHGRLDTCGHTSHQVHKDMHMVQAQGNHHKLSATYLDIPSPSRPTFIGLSSDRFPDNDGDARGHYHSAEDLARVFEGRDTPGGERKNICLHTEESSPGRSALEFDHDSVLIWLNSLNAMQSFRFVPSYHKGHNIQYGLHTKVQIQYVNEKGKSRKATLHLKDIPQIFIGFADEMWACPVMLFLPELYDDGKGFTYLTDDVAQQVMNRFLDCARPYLPDSQDQYMPATSDAAEAIASAGRATSTTTRTTPTYPIPPGNLSDIWLDFTRRAANDTSRMFKGAFLVANAKGFKTSYRRDSMVGSIQAFRAALENAFDLDMCDWGKSMVDIAHDFCPLKDLGRFTFLWRTCCLEKQAQHLHDTFCGGSAGTTNFYHPGFLAETGTLTFEPPMGSLLRESGCCYMQCYNSSKLLYDAMKHLPYQRDELLNLAADRKTFDAIAANAKVSNTKTYAKLIAAFGQDNATLLEMIEAGRDKSMSSRMEFRISLDLWAELSKIASSEDAKAHRRGRNLRVSSISMASPSYVWCIPTPTYIDFLLGNFHKFVSAFHIGQVTSKDHITFERSKVLACFLLCLRAFPTGQAHRHRLLWRDQETDGESVTRGLGFKSSLAAYSFAWFSPLIDWVHFLFNHNISSEMLVLTQIQGWYHNANELVQDTQQAIDTCEELLKVYHTESTQRTLLYLMVHLCLRQYRRDCLQALEKDLVNPVFQKGIDSDEIAFTYHGLKLVFKDFHWHSGNKSKCPTPEKLFDWLWGDKGSLKRTHFLPKPFRAFSKHCTDILREYPLLSAQWTITLQQAFFEYHRVVPFPDINGSLISTTQRKRSWYSIRAVKGSPNHWEWGRKKWDDIEEVFYPDTLTMSRLELEDFLDGL